MLNAAMSACGFNLVGVNAGKDKMIHNLAVYQLMLRMFGWLNHTVIDYSTVCPQTSCRNNWTVNMWLYRPAAVPHPQAWKNHPYKAKQ